MKKWVTFILFFSSVLAVNAQQDVSDAILSAFGAGNSTVLSTYFNDNVELVVGSTDDVFSKQQATNIISDFFRRNKISSFQIIHKGTKETSAFAICNMKAGNASYRVYILTRRVESKQLIQQIRIELSND
ncbi:hypothetical protein MASR2M117_22680 [Paludibacter sp.]